MISMIDPLTVVLGFALIGLCLIASAVWGLVDNLLFRRVLNLLERGRVTWEELCHCDDDIAGPGYGFRLWKKFKHR